MKWETVEIGQLGEVITGNTPPRKNPELYGDYIPFIKPTDMEIDRRYTPMPEECYSELGFEKYRKSLIPKGATCVVTIGSIGKKMTQALSDCFINQAVNAVIPNVNYNEDFVYYLLKNNLDKVKGLDSGTSSGRENVSKSAFSSIEVKVVKHLPTQRKIASILSAYDDLIENNLERIKLLEDAARVSYKEFKIEAKNNWITDTFSKFFTINNGFAFKADWYAEQGVPVIRTRDYSFTKFIKIDQPIFIDDFQAENFSKYLLKEFDFLLIMVGASIGRYGIVMLKDLPALQNQNQWSLRERGEYDYLKVIKVLLIEEILETLMQQRTGAARDFFRASFLNELQISVPPESIGKELNFALENYFKQINTLHKQNTKLREARDILLPKLMNGQIEV